MTETRKTIIFAAAAVVLVLLAMVTAPKRITPNAFVDQGELFFPDFQDPNAARTLEVIDFDEETGAAVPFKVTFDGTYWTIPSHHNHPADARDRLAETAAAVIGIRKDDFRSDNTADHEACGVIDPLDESITGVSGRGQRVTIKGANDVVLADFIIGDPIADRPGFRFVRVPGQKRVYAVKTDIDISTRFKDWIESDLLLVDKDAVSRIVLKDYSINERTRQLDQRGVLTLNKDGDVWTAPDLKQGQAVDAAKVGQFLTAVDELAIEGVRPKPEGLSVSLTRSMDSLRVSTEDMLSLQSKGFYFTRDGRLVSNEGELQILTKEGVRYTLRFGEVVYGSGLSVTAGGGDDDTGPGENRYLFITTEFDSTMFPAPPQPENTNFLSRPDSVRTDADRANKALYDAHQTWRAKQSQRRRISEDLNARFANWYYVISSKSFESLRKTRADLIKEEES